MNNICFVSDFAYPLFNPTAKVTHGGSEVDMHAIATELVNHPHFVVSFVVGNFGQKDRETYGSITLYRSFRTNLHGWRRITYAMFIAIPKLFLALRRAKAEVYFQEGAGYETLLVAIFCRLARKHFVYRVPSRVECTDEFLQLWPIMGRAFRIGLKMADAIVTQDEDEVELLEKNLGLASTAVYSTTPIPEAAKLLPISKRKHVLWVGRLVAMKHPEILLRIAERYPEETFVLNGPAAPNNKAFNEQISLQAARLPNLHFYQGMPRTELEEMYRNAKLFINTSDFEGFPITFIEAGKYGIPILTLNVDPDGIFSKRYFGECANGDVDVLLANVGSWLQDIQKRDEAGRAFREYVEKTNDIKKNIYAYVSLFNQLGTKKYSR
jgi:glycosyltransferase involved in cell wall biosynthesis